MLVEIICGTYGYRNEKGVVQPKDVQSQPFLVSEREAQRLCALGIAKMVEGQEKEEMIKAHMDISQFADMTKKELEKLAKDMGVPSYGSKEEIIARIAETEVEVTEEEVPKLIPAEPEE